MKMKKETVQKIVELLKDKKDIIQSHKMQVLESGKFNNIDTRIAFDCYHILPLEFRNKIRETEDLKDDHIETGMKLALKEIGIV